MRPQNAGTMLPLDSIERWEAMVVGMVNVGARAVTLVIHDKNVTLVIPVITNPGLHTCP